MAEQKTRQKAPDGSNSQQVMKHSASCKPPRHINTALQSQKAVSAYL